MTAPTRDELRAHLLATRIAGDVATPRASNVANITKMLDRHPDYWFGLQPRRAWTFDEVVALMAKRVGIDPDPRRESGPDTIDVELTLDGLDEVAARLAQVVGARGRLLFATGHPTGMLTPYALVARAARDAGATVLTPGDGARSTVDGRSVRIRYVGRVATVGTAADLLHTHWPTPMDTILGLLDDRPDLIVADHGLAGAAAEAGFAVAGFADCNDPALFVGAEEGVVDIAVPLDDNVLPSHYDPLAAYLAAGFGG